MQAYRKIYPAQFYYKYLAHDVRPDARGLHHSRPIQLSCGAISSAYGSSFVRLGSTAFVCGISAELGLAPKSALEPVLLVNVELLPLASPKFKPGRPSDQAQSLSALLTKVITPSINRQELLITEGVADPLSWYLRADIYCLDDAGNLLDASLLGLVAALRDVALPSITEKNAELIASASREQTLSLQQLPFAQTFVAIGDSILTDPTTEEEDQRTGELTLIYSDQAALLAVLQPGGSVVQEQVIRDCMEKAKAKLSSLLETLKSASSTS